MQVLSVPSFEDIKSTAQSRWLSGVFLVFTLVEELAKHWFYSWILHRLEKGAGPIMNAIGFLLNWIVQNPVLFYIGLAISYCFVVLILAHLKATRIAKRRMEILSPLDQSKVNYREVVSGSVYPPNSPVQVLILSGDRRWYTQAEVKIEGTVWSGKAIFGNPDSPPGSPYEIIAISVKSLSSRVMSELPEGVVRSTPIRVYRGEDQRELLDTIRFDYLPTSPLERNWVLSRNENSSRPEFTPPVNPPMIGALFTSKMAKPYALDYKIEPPGTLCDYLKFDAVFSSDSVIYAFVEVVTKDESKADKVWLAYLFGKKMPKQHSEKEWHIWVSGEPFINKWRAFNQALQDDIKDTFGREGWIYKHLLAIRIANSISISPIELWGSKEPLKSASKTLLMKV